MIYTCIYVTMVTGIYVIIIYRALQLPPERWLKIAVLQGSVTLFMIGPDSHVTLKYLGDVGFIPKKDWSG